MRRKEAIATILVTTVLVFLVSGRWIWAQTDDSSKSIEEVARTLAEQNKAIAVPFLKGKAKRKIEKDERTYALPYGESPAALFKLPDYTSPYTLKVTSLCNCIGFRKSMLVPSGLFLDADFKQTRKFEEADLKTNQPGFKKGMNAGASFDINETRKSDRYLLIYTRADLLGQTADKLNAPGLGGVLFGGAMRVSRSANGTLELEAAVEKKK
jgi:Maltose operon periplasmic protein precursor (MalM)